MLRIFVVAIAKPALSAPLKTRTKVNNIVAISEEVCRKLFANWFPIKTLRHHSNFAVHARCMFCWAADFNLRWSGQRMAQFSTKRNCGSAHAVSMLPIADEFREFRVSCYSATENKNAILWRCSKDLIIKRFSELLYHVYYNKLSVIQYKNIYINLNLLFNFEYMRLKNFKLYILKVLIIRPTILV